MKKYVYLIYSTYNNRVGIGYISQKNTFVFTSIYIYTYIAGPVSLALYIFYRPPYLFAYLRIIV